MNEIPTAFDIDPLPLEQIKNVERIIKAIFFRVSAFPDAILPSSTDLINLAKLLAVVRELPQTHERPTLTLSVRTSSEPTKSFKRAQFGHDVIDLSDTQVEYDPRDGSEWTAILKFGADLHLGSGCKSQEMVAELAEWLAEMEQEALSPGCVWRITEGHDAIERVSVGKQDD